jgi:hypothetical protein
MRFSPTNRRIEAPTGKSDIIDARNRELCPNQDCLTSAVPTACNGMYRGLEGG